MYLPLFVGTMCLSLFFSVYILVSFLDLQSFYEEERAGFFVFFLMSCNCKCYVALSHCTVRSAVSEYSIS